MHNHKRVVSVELELPALKVFEPLRFVDTPRLGSALAHNTVAALDWLPKVGAALVAISSDAPLSERDLELLNGLRQHMPSIVILLTTADLLIQVQRTEVLEYVEIQPGCMGLMKLPVPYRRLRLIAVKMTGLPDFWPSHLARFAFFISILSLIVKNWPFLWPSSIVRNSSGFGSN